jgi:phosphatase NudJ
VTTFTFVLVVVEHDRRFVLVQEAKGGQPWYLPAGRVEPRESLTDAALRETREEAGIDVVLTGVLRVEHTPLSDGSARLRVWFKARPVQPDAPLKQQADRESLQARWFSLEEARMMNLRGEDVLQALTASALFPLSLLSREP